MADQLLMVRQVAERLACSEWKVWDMIHKGELRSIKVGRLERIDPRDVEAFIGRNRRVVEL